MQNQRSRSLKWRHSSSNPATPDPRGRFKTEKKETASIQRRIQRGREFLELAGIGGCDRRLSHKELKKLM